MSTALDMSSDTVVPSDRPSSAAGRDARLAQVAVIDEAMARREELRALLAQANEDVNEACFGLAKLVGWKPGDKSPAFKFRHPSGANVTLVVKKDRGGIKDHAFLKGLGATEDYSDL
jgi:hypothetical protein